LGVEGTCLYRFTPKVAIGVLVGIEGDIFKSLSHNFDIKRNAGDITGTLELGGYKPCISGIVGAKILFISSEKITMSIKYQFVYGKNSENLKVGTLTRPRVHLNVRNVGDVVTIKTNYIHHRVLFGIEYNFVEESK